MTHRTQIPPCPTWTLSLYRSRAEQCGHLPGSVAQGWQACPQQPVSICQRAWVIKRGAASPPSQPCSSKPTPTAIRNTAPTIHPSVPTEHEIERGRERKIEKEGQRNLCIYDANEIKRPQNRYVGIDCKVINRPAAPERMVLCLLTPLGKIPAL